MSDQITLVTAPDDVFHEAMRLLFVDLDEPQTEIISRTLTSFETIPSIVSYVWRTDDPIEWLLDKRLKSQAIFVNAESEHQDIVGHLIDKPNVYHFGALRNLHMLNNKTIYAMEDFKEIINQQIGKYEKQL